LLDFKVSQLAELPGQSASKTLLLIWKIQDCFAPWMRERRSTRHQELTSSLEGKRQANLCIFALFSHIYFFAPAMRKKDIFTLQAM